VANYLARHDWLRGQPIWSKAMIAPSQFDAVMQKLQT
jgi:membrane-bound lytic murein transglycosylase B